MGSNKKELAANVKHTYTQMCIITRIEHVWLDQIRANSKEVETFIQRNVLHFGAFLLRHLRDLSRMIEVLNAYLAFKPGRRLGESTATDSSTGCQPPTTPSTGPDSFILPRRYYTGSMNNHKRALINAIISFAGIYPYIQCYLQNLLFGDDNR